jgi:hypothetical protein
VTIAQTLVLFKHSEKRLLDVLKFDASIHGAKLKDSSGPAKKKKNDPFMFGDPDEYKKLSPKEKQKMTDAMMLSHKVWINQSKPMGGKQARMG